MRTCQTPSFRRTAAAPPAHPQVLERPCCRPRGCIGGRAGQRWAGGGASGTMQSSSAHRFRAQRSMLDAHQHSARPVQVGKVASTVQGMPSRQRALGEGRGRQRAGARFAPDASKVVEQALQAKDVELGNGVCGCRGAGASGSSWSESELASDGVKRRWLLYRHTRYHSCGRDMLRQPAVIRKLRTQYARTAAGHA